MTGGNIIINTSATIDLPPTHTEAATEGYCFLPSSNPLHRYFLSYSQHVTSLGGLGSRAQPSYLQAAQSGLQEGGNRPGPPITPSGRARDALIGLEVLSEEETTNATRQTTPAIGLLTRSASRPDSQLGGPGILCLDIGKGAPREASGDFHPDP